MNFRSDAWLAGFIDGEGCFSRYSTPRGFAPQFSLGQRWEDEALLRALAVELGGGVYSHGGVLMGRAQPCFRWAVSKRADLLGLVEYLDRYPLRTRKADQLARWRDEHAAWLLGRNVQTLYDLEIA